MGFDTIEINLVIPLYIYKSDYLKKNTKFLHRCVRYKKRVSQNFKIHSYMFKLISNWDKNSAPYFKKQISRGQGGDIKMCQDVDARVV